MRKGHTKVVKVLIENGADMSIKNLRGKTPIDLAYGNYENGFILLSHINLLITFVFLDKNKILMMLLKAEKEQNDEDD